MSRRRRRRALLVPEARAALDQLRDAVVVEQSRSFASHPHEVSQPSGYAAGASASPSTQGVASRLGIPYQLGDNGELTTRQAGKIGGAIGGSMIQRLISIAEQELAREKADHVPRL